MKAMTMLVCAGALGAMLAGCGKRDDEGNYVPQEGRKETETLQGTDTLGYGYTRKKVDKALDTNDRRVDQLNEELEKQEQ
jgi:hypothetical protein